MSWSCCAAMADACPGGMVRSKWFTLGTAQFKKRSHETWEDGRAMMALVKLCCSTTLLWTAPRT
jgi:hypothetical protein